jgi:hypothetical protein
MERIIEGVIVTRGRRLSGLVLVITPEPGILGIRE